MIKQTTIDRVRELSIVDVVKNYIDLKKEGAVYKASCPFHEEKTPSFVVSEARGHYKCFGCGKAGGVIGFVRDYFSLTFQEAVKRLANDFGITVEYEELSDEERQTRERERAEKEELYHINELAARLYGQALRELGDDHPAYAELVEGRQYSTDTILQWQIGYAPGPSGASGYKPEEWQYLYKELKETGLVKPALQLGLIKQKKGTYYDAFRHRLVFPVWDANGRLAGFGARRLGKGKEAKYLNSPDSPVYHKGEILYGLNFAAQSISALEYAYLVEGYTDVISWHQAGVLNTVGTCGTALTEAQIKLLRKYTRRVVLAYDADPVKGAGDKLDSEKIIRTADMLLEAGFTVHICHFPVGQDPDSFARSVENLKQALKEIEVDAVSFKAEQLLTDALPVQRDDRFNDVARSLAMLNMPVLQSDLGRKISRQYGLDWATMKKLIDNQKKIRERKERLTRVVRKNKVVNLNGQAKVYPFFEEQYKEDGSFKGIYINRFKLIQLLKNFGYYRYEIVEDSSYTFVQIRDNLIRQVHRDLIIDHMERFINEDYDFAGAGCDYVDAEMLINKFYGSLGSYFSKDLFARLQPEDEIIINRDTVDATYFYYQNGFVRVTAEGRELLPYDRLQGSIWEDQTLNRNFTNLPSISLDREYNDPLEELGVMGDFCWKVSGENPQRFFSLCSIIGYLTHDFYDYKLKAILLTDSTLSDLSEGRSGKSLLGKLIGQVRSYCEINGKDFDANDKKKYQDARLDTQIVHLNDVKHQGRNKFDFESMFNDITEGYIVDGKWMKPFRNWSKFLISSNRTINIQGASQMDRITEYEMSNYFNVDHRPEQEYGHWLMRDWDADEWNRYDNFMCYCAQTFHKYGIIEPETINLHLRKLRDHTREEFLEFMAEVKSNLEKTGAPFPSYYNPEGAPIGSPDSAQLTEFVFDKRRLYRGIIEMFPDLEQKWFTQNLFTRWLRLYADKMLGIKKMKEWRSNGVAFFQFAESDKK